MYDIKVGVKKDVKAKCVIQKWIQEPGNLWNETVILNWGLAAIGYC